MSLEPNRQNLGNENADKTENGIINPKLINRDSQTNLPSRPVTRSKSARKICPPAPAPSDLNLTLKKSESPEELRINDLPNDLYESIASRLSSCSGDGDSQANETVYHADDQYSVSSGGYEASSTTIDDVCSIKSDSEESDYEPIPEIIRSKWPEGVPTKPKSYRTMVNVALLDPKNVGGLKFHEICKYLRESFKAPLDHIVEKKARAAITTMMNQKQVASIRKQGIIEPIYVTHADKCTMNGSVKPKRYIVPEMRMCPPPGALRPPSRPVSSVEKAATVCTDQLLQPLKEQVEQSPPQKLKEDEFKRKEININDFVWDTIPQGHHPASRYYENPSGFRLINSSLDMQIRPLHSLPLDPQTTLDGITTPQSSYLPYLPTVNFTVSRPDDRPPIVEEEIYSLDPVYLRRLEKLREIEEQRTRENEEQSQATEQIMSTVGERLGLPNRSHMSRINDPSFVDMTREIEPPLYREHLSSLNQRSSEFGQQPRPAVFNTTFSSQQEIHNNRQTQLRQVGSEQQSRLGQQRASSHARLERFTMQHQLDQEKINFLETQYYGDAEDEEVIEECWTRLRQRGLLRPVDLEIKRSLSQRFKSKRVERDMRVMGMISQERSHLNGDEIFTENHQSYSSDLTAYSNHQELGPDRRNAAQEYQSIIRNYLQDFASGNSKALSVPRPSSSNVPRALPNISSRTLHF